MGQIRIKIIHIVLSVICFGVVSQCHPWIYTTALRYYYRHVCSASNINESVRDNIQSPLFIATVSRITCIIKSWPFQTVINYHGEDAMTGTLAKNQVKLWYVALSGVVCMKHVGSDLHAMVHAWQSMPFHWYYDKLNPTNIFRSDGIIKHPHPSLNIAPLWPVAHPSRPVSSRATRRSNLNIIHRKYTGITVSRLKYTDEIGSEKAAQCRYTGIYSSRRGE